MDGRVDRELERVERIDDGFEVSSQAYGLAQEDHQVEIAVPVLVAARGGAEQQDALQPVAKGGLESRADLSADVGSKHLNLPSGIIVGQTSVATRHKSHKSQESRLGAGRQ